MADDVLSAELAEIRRLEQAATRGPWREGRAHNGGPRVETSWLVPKGYVGSGMPVHVTNSLLCTAGKFEEEVANARFIAAARTDVPRLLAAVEAVLEIHAVTAFHQHTEACPQHYATVHGRAECRNCKVITYTGCDSCKDEYGNPARPEDCKTRQEIARALLGEEKNGG